MLTNLTHERRGEGHKRFLSRNYVGKRLALRLAGCGLREPLVLALPKGGVPVAYQVASHMGAPLEAVLSLKIYGPSGACLGALAEGGNLALDREAVRESGLSHEDLRGLVKEQQRLLERRLFYYRPDHRLPDMGGRDVVLVDDFIDSGWSAMAALQRIRQEGPARLLLAVPLLSALSLKDMGSQVERVVYLHAPEHLGKAGDWYHRFDKVDEETALKMLDQRTP